MFFSVAVICSKLFTLNPCHAEYIKMPHPLLIFTYLMANSADPDQLASSSQLIWIYTACQGRVYPGSAGQGLSTTHGQSGSTCAVFIVFFFFFFFLNIYLRFVLIFLYWFQKLLRFTTTLKISENLYKWNLLKTCFKSTYPTNFALPCQFY